MKKTLIILLIILAIASFFRLWQLDSIPPGLYPDEAMNANDAFEAFQTKDFKVFYPENNGREGLFINLIAFSFFIFGASIWAIRIVPAIIGIITVLGLYLLVKELFRKSKSSELIALASSFFLATSFWHINFSRIGFRAIMTPFVLVFSLYFLFKGFRTKKILNFIIAGIIFGIGFHTYISFRLAIFLIMAVLFFWLLNYWKEKKKYFILTFFFLLFVFIAALPIGIYFLDNPEHFISRATGVSIFSQPSLIKAFSESLIKHLAMFNFQGDGNWRHNIASSPVLFWPVGILFLIGLAISIKEWIFSIKNKSYSTLTLHSTLIGWWFILMLPGILTYEGVPHSLRCIGSIPPTFIFAALSVDFLYQKIKPYLKLTTWTSLIAILALAALTTSFAFVQYSRYFIIWGRDQNVKGAFTQKFVEIGNYLNSHSPETQRYVIVNEPGVPVPFPDGIPMPAQTLMFMENARFGGIKSTYLKPGDLDQIKINDKKTTIIPMKNDDALFESLIKRFPEGEIGIQIKTNIGEYLINF